MKKIILLLVQLCVYGLIHAQLRLHVLHPQTIGTGGVVATARGIPALYGNPGGLESLDQTKFNLNTQWYPKIKGTHLISAGIARPLGSSWFASLSAQRIGDDVFRVQKAGITLGHRIGNTSAGLRLNWLQVGTAEFGYRNSWGLDVGTVSRIGEVLLAGLYINNLNAPLLDRQSGEFWPLRFSMGLSVEMTEYLTTSLQWMQDLQSGRAWSLGLNYSTKKKINFQLGISGLPVRVHAGVGIGLKKGVASYAIMSNYNLGPAHSWGVEF